MNAVHGNVVRSEQNRSVRGTAVGCPYAGGQPSHGNEHLPSAGKQGTHGSVLLAPPLVCIFIGSHSGHMILEQHSMVSLGASLSPLGTVATVWPVVPATDNR
jgi:hypothetical protein